MPTQPPPPQRKLPLVLGLMSAYFAGWVRSPPAALPLPGFLASFVGAHRIGLGAAIKALPVALIATDVAAVAGPRSGPARDDYAPSVAAGLVLGSLGDVFLDLSSTNPKLFTAGLVSFLLSHLVYIRGFASLGSTTNWTAAGSVYGLTYGILYRYIWAHVPAADKPGVLAYCTVIATMWYKAITSKGRRTKDTDRKEPQKSRQRLMSVAGSTLFVASDLLLAIDRFNPALMHRLADSVPFLFASPKAFVMTTYYAAQLLIGYAVTL